MVSSDSSSSVSFGELPKSPYIWFNGELIPWEKATVHVLTHTLHYGLGVFEGVRAYEVDAGGSAIFRVHDHTSRLFDSAHILGMKIPFSQEQLIQAQKQIIRENKLGDAYLRPMCFYGDEGLGLRADNLSVNVIVAAWYWPSYMSPEALAKGIRVKTSSYNRHHVNVSMCKAKANGQYINSMLALREAISAGYDEALLLDTAGYVSEGSGQNIFIVRNGVLSTPDATTCLPGITRDTIFYLANNFGLQVRERPITRDEVYIADEVFYVGTASEVVPVHEIDGRVIGKGGRGELTEKFQTTYMNCVKGKYTDVPSDWLTQV